MIYKVMVRKYRILRLPKDLESDAVPFWNQVEVRN